MLSLEQLSQMVKVHLGLYSDADGVQHFSKWIIGESSLGGRGLFATQDISSGEVLFVDHPIIRGPRSGTTVSRGCTVCCSIESDTFFKCSKCSLLLCSEECQETTTHDEDCTTICRWQNKIPIDEIDDAILSRALAPIRALRLSEDQKILMAALQVHSLPRHGAEVRELKECFDIPEDDEDLMTLACCALDTNAFQIATPYGKKEMSLRGLYPVSGLMNHNCVPNTRHSYNKDSQMAVKAVKPIRAGCEIFTSYTGTLWGTPARRTHLYKTKHFFCECDRCADPTERGTLLAALKCFSAECPGSLLPINPLNASSPWRCIECDLRVPIKNICTIQSALGSLMGSLDFENVDQSSVSSDLGAWGSRRASLAW
ncbi:SET domain-containing protein SmydA-8-like [Ostrinia nubilalis]|uniref:SET domain-containing protein SmydA-8-like n=1 Tax=Ostrinia nubilalis TaxID=29057 RepID=UPI00308249B5